MKSVTAENIKRIIRYKCLKQNAIAERAGYTHQSFNNMLNGRKLVTDVDVMKISRVLEVEPNELYGVKTERGD